MNRITINADLGGPVVSRHIYGHFAEHLGRCIYDGFWVGEGSDIPNTRGIRSDIVEALRALRIPNLRWPGGCFADEYHWMDGVGPRAKRPAMLNTHWGGISETNAFGTHEFFDLCSQLHCEPYLCGNLGSGTVHEMQQWIEYITFDGDSPMADRRRQHGRDKPWGIAYWGVGNENWGCGGNMRAEYYADEYRRYATYCRDLSANRLCRIACGPHGSDVHWTEVMMRQVFQQKPRLMQGLALHYYCGSGSQSRSATDFGEEDWVALLSRAARMDAIIRSHRAVMDRYDPEEKVGLIVDEWGAWHNVEPGTNPGFLYQQNSIRDALVAAVTLHIFHDHCARVRMANIAQTVNVLQAMVLTEGERMLRTPTYHVFDMLKVHQDATRLPLAVSCEQVQCGGQSIPLLSASASKDGDGTVHLSVCNLSPTDTATVTCVTRGMPSTVIEREVLSAGTITAHNTFDEPDAVCPEPADAIRPRDDEARLELPPRSVTLLTWPQA